MPNENFYVYPSELFDPKKSDNPTREIRYLLEDIADTAQPNPIHDIMNNALSQWIALESSKKLKDIWVIKTYQNIINNYDPALKTLPYYYLEWQPDVNFEGWYLHMINTANAHGYTVYSDVDARFYLANGRSYPEFARLHLERLYRLQQPSVEEDYEAVKAIMADEAKYPPETGVISDYLLNIYDRVEIFTAILKHCFAKYGIEADVTTEKGRGFYITLYWQNEVQFILQYDIMEYLVFKVKLNLRIEVNWQDLMIKEKIRTMGFFDEWGGGVSIDWNDTQQLLIAICDQYRMSMEGIREHSEKEWEQQWDKIYSQQTCNTITELNAKLTQQIDDFVQNVYRYGNLYDFVDALYQDRHPLHHYFWTSIYVVPTLGGILQMARYVGHPKLKEMIEKQVLRAEQAPQQVLNHSEKKRLDLYVEKYLPDYKPQS